ncbi:Glutamyl-tRNA reductase [gamma proteobacterium HdN1]|nr:Glutamyl-tRNA reductase [gamma proteobacterium HdN1]
MTFLALGINHRTAPVDVRERVAFMPDRLGDALREACELQPLREVAILSTCNRMELYCVAEDKDAPKELFGWLGRYHALSVDKLRGAAYQFWDDQAVRHIMRVASGLDSMVLGEPQVLGQLKDAFAKARDARTLGPNLGRLFQQAFSVAKQVRTDTDIGANPVSVAYAAVSLARHIFSDLSKSSALLIGAGETMELVARHLHEQGVQKIVVANRTLERASVLAERFNGRSILLEEIPAALNDTDIVITSTASPLPIIGKGMVEKAMRVRRHKPVFMVDIAVPRDVEEAVGELDDVYLYTVDDLQQVIDENRKQREAAATQAEGIVLQRTASFMDGLRALDATTTIREYRTHVEQLRTAELEKAVALIQQGANAEEVMQRLSQALVNKIMHHPSVTLKRAAEEGRVDRLEWARDLFGLVGDPRTCKRLKD